MQASTTLASRPNAARLISVGRLDRGNSPKIRSSHRKLKTSRKELSREDSPSERDADNFEDEVVNLEALTS